MFPERAEPRRRPLLTLAITFSLLLHAAGALVWIVFWPHVAPVVAKLLPQPSPTPEIVALSDAITIEKRTVPPARRRAQPQRRRPVSRPQPRRIAALPALPAPPVPTLPPVPTTAPTREPTVAPTTEPTYRPVKGTIHHPRAEPTPEPLRPRAEKPSAPSARGAFSPQQIAALDAKFQRTIDSAQRSLTYVPPQRRPPARSPQQLRFEQVMAGTPEQFLAAQGICDPLESREHGAIVERYLRCDITYSDGYFEQVSFPWTFRFLRRYDPFAYNDGQYHPFPMQAPPPGFVLPHPFAFSRAICSFYRAECVSLIERERANGNQPAP
jgi:hypothetical protein